VKDYTTYNDASLVDLLTQGDQEAMTEIYNRYWMKLLAVAVNRLTDEQEAEECVQDVFLSLWKRRARLELRYQLSTYLWVAIKYQVINRLDKRYAKKNISTTELTDDISVPSAEAQILEKELLERIEQAVGQLPAQCRMIYKMSREDGKSNKDIAAELNISEKTVEGHITRALKGIRNNLSLTYPLWIILDILKNKI
jgi:RNA polymerase sigma-70 factor (family 1)